MGKAQVLPEVRVIQMNSPRDNEDFKFVSNGIKTTKYSLYTFFPKGIYEQFRRVANVYFLAVAILSCTPVSPVNPVTNVAPLVLVISLSLAKEAFEDSKRKKKDQEVNSTVVEVLRGKALRRVRWKNVVVGDIVKVRDRGFIPADIVVLNSSNANGVCYVETMNLDGETNLKHKQACDASLRADTDDKMLNLKYSIECEQPNESLYTFTGNMYTGRIAYPLTPNQILLRGCVLRNTEYAYGLVVFTGHETKVMMNSTAVPSKRSKLERQLDYLIVAIFAMLFLICMVGAVGSAMWVDGAHWYLALEVEGDSSLTMFDPSGRPTVGLLAFMTLVTLYSSIIPISLYVSIEIIKYIQAGTFINQDIEMYDLESDTPALARTSNLNEELGQVQHILSDKTGTLTCNRMEFFKCSIGGVSYGEGVTEIQMLLRANSRAGEGEEAAAVAAAARQGPRLSVNAPTKPAIPGCNFNDKRLEDGNWRSEAQPELICEFFRLLSICHTVLPEERKLEGGGTEIEFQASSPDEAALVAAAKWFGYLFCRRQLEGVTVKDTVEGVEEVQQHYAILAVLEFNSFRKRQSVIAQLPDGSIRLYCKGADNVIFERLDPGRREHLDATREHLLEYGNDGLRTLCLAYRDIGKEEFGEWKKLYQAARTSQRNREEETDAVAELIEKKLVLIGCTAIEDKLQPGVPQSILALMQAGIKLWVLTGDKVETAMNIGYACNLLNSAQKIFVIASEESDREEMDEICMTAKVKGPLTKALAYRKDQLETGAEALSMSLVLDGKVLEAILASDELKQLMLDVGQCCKSVICCRVSPLQKAVVTKVVKESTKRTTLAIGDGANDVGMIQSADVGVGISGQEGRQAVMSSDFAIAQFSFLVRLLLVHGQWSYRRISRVITYFFYKNITYTLTQFWFNLYSGFSGQRLYDDWYQSLYNIMFTAIPVMAMGLLDQDASAQHCMAIPQLYRSGQKGELFNVKVFLVWMASSVWQSLVCFYVPVWSMAVVAIDSQGHTAGQWAVGTVACCVVIITVNLRLLLECSYHTWITYVSVIGSIFMWFAYVAIYCSIWPSALGMDNMSNIYLVIHKIATLPAFWLNLLLCPVAALLPDVVYKLATRMVWPSDHDLVQEAEKVAAGGGGADDKEGDREGLLMNATRLSGEGMLPSPGAAGKRHTGYAFEDPAHEGYHARQARLSAGPQSAQNAANARTSHLLANSANVDVARTDSSTTRGTAGKQSSKKKMGMNVVVSRSQS